MRQRGVIIRKEADEVVVQVQNPSSACGSCGGCVRLTPSKPADDYVVKIKDSAKNYDVGDDVIVESHMGQMVKAVAVLYGIPFVSLFVGYGVARAFTASDPMSALGAVAGLIGGAILARPIAQRLSKGGPEFKIVARACS